MRWRFQYLCLTVACLMSPVGVLRADVIHLLQGGELRGELQSSAADDSAPTLTIHTLAGSIVAVPREQVSFVAERPALIEEYITRSRRTEHTVAAHWTLAEWCREQRLDEERREQLDLILDLEPDHADARRLLGYVEENGRWMTRDEMMESRGYIKQKGKWVTRQELDLIEKNAEQRKAEIAWYPQVRTWFGWLGGTDGRRRTLALEEFRKITTADAIPALRQFLATHESADYRSLFVAVLGQIESPAAVAPLMDRYLNDISDIIRRQTLELLTTERYAPAIPILVAALKSDANEVVRRAAVALQKIADRATVPALIEALITAHRYKVQVPSSSGISIGYTPNGQAGMVDPRAISSSLPPDVAMMARAGQLPYGAIVLPPVGQVNIPKFVNVRAEIQNHEVLAALESITGKNLGFNERDWQLWWSLNHG